MNSKTHKAHRAVLTAYRDHRAMAGSISVTEGKRYWRILGVQGYYSYSLLRPGGQSMTPRAGCKEKMPWRLGGTFIQNSQEHRGRIGTD